MPAPRQDVTDAELAVLERLWEADKATIRELTDHLYPGGRTSDYATVQKLLERLEGKRCVRRDRRRTPHLFRASVDRAQLIDSRLRDVADSLCGGAMSPLLSRLVESSDLGAEEVDALRALVDRLDRGDREEQR